MDYLRLFHGYSSSLLQRLTRIESLKLKRTLLASRARPPPPSRLGARPSDWLRINPLDRAWIHWEPLGSWLVHSFDVLAKMRPYSLLDLTIFWQPWPDLTTARPTPKPSRTPPASHGFWASDAENTIIYSSNYNVLYAFMEHPRDGGGTAARAASKTRRVTDRKSVV